MAEQELRKKGKERTTIRTADKIRILINHSFFEGLKSSDQYCVEFKRYKLKATCLTIVTSSQCLTELIIFLVKTTKYLLSINELRKHNEPEKTTTQTLLVS